MPFTEVYTAQLGAVQKTGHGQKGIGDVAVVMVWGVTGFIIRVRTFIEFLGEAKGILKRRKVKFRVNQPQDMHNFIVDCFRRIHLNQGGKLVFVHRALNTRANFFFWGLLHANFILVGPLLTSS